MVPIDTPSALRPDAADGWCFVIGTVACGNRARELWSTRPPPFALRHRERVTAAPSPGPQPLSRADQVLLRRLVLEHKADERRHRFPAVLHVGRPGRPELGRFVEDPRVPAAAALDLALRCELLAAVLHRRAEGPVMTWLT